MKYSQLPIDLGEFSIPWNEYCYYLYLPIKMGKSFFVKIPERLEPFRKLVGAALVSLGPQNADKWIDSYLYLTVKHFLVSPDYYGARGDAHVSGFGTDDLNWIWCSSNPIEFNGGDFGGIIDHPVASLEQFKERWDNAAFVQKGIKTYPHKHLLEVSPFCVYRTPRPPSHYMRTFVKITLSRHKLNFIGNSHNHLFDYNWPMISRTEHRNVYVPDDVA